MPAYRLGAEAFGSPFTTAGQDSEATSEFVRHVGLARENRESLGPTDVIGRDRSSRDRA